MDRVDLFAHGLLCLRIMLTLLPCHFKWHWQLTGSVFFMVLFGGLLALGNPSNKGTMIAFVFLSQTGYGWAIYLSIAVYVNKNPPDPRSVSDDTFLTAH